MPTPRQKKTNLPDPAPAKKVLKLWIENETGLWLVMDDLAEYDLSKPMARSAVLDELQTCIRENGPR
jgi:hypothetical protein